jgi:endo-1,4-beta-xylanase
MDARVPHFILFLLLLPACPNAFALTIPATEARIRTVGAPQRDAWNLFSNGEVGDYVNVSAPGSYRLDVEAWGSPADGVWPDMAVDVDGDTVDHVEVRAPDAKKYAFPLRIDSGNHRITVRFTNDRLTATEDRNLFLQTLTLVPADGQVEPAPGDEAAWRADRARAETTEERDELSRAAASIEKLRKQDVSVIVTDADGRPVNGARVRIEQTGHEFLFGCNIYGFDHLKTEAANEEYKRRFSGLFNYATVGFYWRSYEPRQGEPIYPYTDRVVAWCRTNGIRMKGHPLLWQHEAGIPVWSDGQPSPETQRRRVTDILRRYSGQIEFWEVVNEPSHLPQLRIDDPYRWAREADPNARLIVNDYQVMADGCPPFHELLRKALADRVPFDGIGIQAHEPRTMRFPLPSVRRTLDRYAALGKDLHITEFTPTSAGEPVTGSCIGNTWDEAAQADYAEKFYTECFAHPAVVAITWWDLCDSQSWLKGGGLLRSDLTPKPAYETLRRLIHETWMTRASGETDKAGRFAFRGFRGTYSVTAEQKGRPARSEILVRKHAPNVFPVTLDADP